MSARQKFRPTRFFLDRAANVDGAEADPARISLTPPTGVHWVDGYSKARIKFFGTDAANEAATVQIHFVDTDVEHPESHDGPVTYYTTLFCDITATLGTATGVANSQIPATNLLADTLADNEHALTELDGAFDRVTSAFWSPAADGWGEYMIGSLGATQGFMIQYKTFTSVASINAIIQLHV